MFRLPAITHTEAGEWRRVGFEVEFTGLALEQATAALAEALDLKIVDGDAAHSILEGDELGKFRVELDWEFLKRQAAGDEASDKQSWVDLLSQAAEHLVPVEIVCPPIAVNQLEVLEGLTTSLQSAGAKGTRNSLVAAFGVHINTEIPDLAPATVWNYLRSFVLLQWWLVDVHEVDLARRLSPYVDLYPEAYLRDLANSTEPASDLDNIALYLAHNPTRNRALDMLPLFTEINAAAVEAKVDDTRIKARPTFHYRLPNCLIDEPGWSLSSSWDVWVTIDDLAQRPADLDRLAAEFLKRQRPLIGVDRSDWCIYIDQWLKDRELA